MIRSRSRIIVVTAIPPTESGSHLLVVAATHSAAGSRRSKVVRGTTDGIPGETAGNLAHVVVAIARINGRSLGFAVGRDARNGRGAGDD